MSAQPAPLAVLLDFHNTLVVPRSIDGWIAQVSAQCEGAVPDGVALAERIRNVWRDARERFPTVEWDLDPVAHRRVFVSMLTRDDGVPVEFAQRLYETMPEQWALNAGAADFLARAARAGIRLALVSNTALNVRPALESWGISDAFDAVVLSYEVGLTKPDPRIFALAADALDVDPRYCVMIGDSAHDDGAARALGISCLIERPDEMWRAFEAACPP